MKLELIKPIATISSCLISKIFVLLHKDKMNPVAIVKKNNGVKDTRSLRTKDASVECSHSHLLSSSCRRTDNDIIISIIILATGLLDLKAAA